MQGESSIANPIVTEWRSHWPTGLAAFVGIGLGGSVGPVAFSLFIEPLEEAFGWSRGEIGLAHMASIASALSAPILGRVIDRMGVRRPMLVSFALIGLFWLLLAAMPGQIVIFYALFTALTVVGLPTTGLGFARAISAVFERSRGFSLAVTRAGMSLSGALLPLLLYAVMSAYGWRAGYATMAALALLGGLPIVWLGIERRRQSARLDDVPKAPSAPGTLRVRMDRTVVIIAVATALAYAPLVAITTQAQPLIVAMGIDGATAAKLVGLFGVSSVIGAFITGYLLDRIWAPAVALAIMTLGASGALALALLPGSPAFAALGMFLVGFAMGAETDISAFMVARYCGVARFSSVYGVVILAIGLASSVGSTGIGFLYDAQDSYTNALLIAAACLVLASIGYLTLGRYPEPTGVTRT